MADTPHTPPDDDAWARRTTAAIAAGSRDALASLYEHRFDFLYRSVRERTGRDESFALDCVQDAMLRVARSTRTVPTAAALDAWLRRIVLSAALDRLRSDVRRASREASLATGSRPDATEPEVLQQLERELASLCDDDRSLLELRFRRGLTLAQLGASAGLTPKAADSRIRRALDRLRSAFGASATGKELL